MEFGKQCAAGAAMGLGAFLALSAPAQAAQVRYSGSGAVTAITPSGGGSVAVGDTLTFSFVFDTAQAFSVFNGGPTFQVYGQPLTNVSASIGNYTFEAEPSGGSPPVILLGTGFRVFPNEPFSSPVLNQSFILPGLASGNAPFGNGQTGGVTFSLESTFRQDLTGIPVSLDKLSDPAGAAINRFTLSVNDGQRSLGFVEGSFSGSFAAVAGVPEPETWGLLILGFGIVGGAMRSRRVTRTALPA